jgi:transcriptional regulator
MHAWIADPWTPRAVRRDRTPRAFRRDRTPRAFRRDEHELPPADAAPRRLAVPRSFRARMTPMYTPPAFRVDDQDWIHAFVEANDFGMLVTASPLMVSHLPFHLAPPSDGKPARLLCHLARANPQWRAFEGTGAEALAVFRGPHTYVSSAWYGAQPAVPTWNYDAVTARGHATLIEDTDAIAVQMRALAFRYEPDPGFDMDAQPARYMEGMFKALVGVSIEVAEWTGKRKQSQNRPMADRVAVAARLEERGENAAAQALRDANGL